MRSRQMILGLAIEIALTLVLAARLFYQWDMTVITFVAWLSVMSANRMWFLASKIARIGDQLGFGVSVPITEMPRVMNQIQSRIKGSAADMHPDTAGVEGMISKAKRPKRDILAELADLENETP